MQLSMNVDDVRIEFEGREYRRLRLLLLSGTKLEHGYSWHNDALCRGYEIEGRGGLNSEDTVFFDDRKTRDERFRGMRTGYYLQGFRKVEGPLPGIECRYRK